MQSNHVELPSEELIDPGVLIKAIVKALYPDKTEGLTGMECIEGKLVQITANRNKPIYPDTTAGFIALDLTEGKPILITADPNTENFKLDFGTERDSDSLFSREEAAEIPPQLKLPIEQPQYTQDLLSSVVEDDKSVTFRLPYALTDEDRKELEPLLDKLPPLEYPMTENAISKFLDAYMALPQRPSWVPTIITWETISRRLEEQNAAAGGHKAAIQQAIEEGKLSACDVRRVPTRFLSMGTLIPRNSVVEYLTQYGLTPKEKLHPAVEEIESEADRPEGVYTASGQHVWNKRGTDKAWTDEEKAAVKAKLGTIDPKTDKPFTRRKVAELLGLRSPGRITQILNELEDQPQIPESVFKNSLIEIMRVNKKR